MGARQRRKKKFRVNKLRLVLIAVIIVLIVAMGLSIKNVMDLRQEQAQLKQTNSSLKDRKVQLETELKNVNNLNYIEEQARIQLKLIKPGEVLYVLDDDDSGDKDK
ncbi:FtsB family cell division protein [Aminicella lysinilytica]|uniref:Cell division protein DivIC n=2 Tax=Aminicella lysinilytica TaxID=433323 RepID=A0A4R6Q9K4_9FIRM|nr:septum formation initiator family protein [Aminicella lysinilytica]NLD11581.1 hypothetical protein [Clostridiales bacterium]TDP58981.1 cell division protein DivIC [Aminicella lysinilytica]